MPEPLARPIGATRLKAKGRIAVPADYRKRHKLLEGSEVFLIQLGEALMVVPSDQTFDHLCQRIYAALARKGVSVEQALKNLEKVRRRRLQRLYGKG
jgi:bifunctional DNA-binding transcriptional regulator/antitoxin component of YhaV-PrlF toxin-antitoxin module